MSTDAIIFPPSDEAPMHVPIFLVNGVLVPEGYAHCLRCDRQITLVQFTDEVCPGRKDAA